MENIQAADIYEVWCAIAYEDTLKATWNKTFDELPAKEQEAWKHIVDFLQNNH